MALTPRQKQARRLWKMRALGLGYDDGGGGDGGGGPSLTEQVIAFFGGGEEGGIWDFTDAANLATATDGTGAVSNGSAIAYAADLSGNGNHLLQTTAGLRPTWNSAGYASFASDWMTVNWTATAEPINRVSRLYPGAWVSTARFFAGGTTSGNRAVFFQNTSSPNAAIFRTTISANVEVPLSQYNTVRELYNGSASEIRVNGTPTTVNPGTGPVGGLSVAGEPNNTGVNSSLRVVRVLMIDRDLTSEELTTAEAWAEEVL